MLIFVLLGGVATGCASSAASKPARPVAGLDAPTRPGALDGLRRVAVVASGETRYAGASRAQSGAEPVRELEDVLKWFPYRDITVPIARAVYHGVTWLMNAFGTSSAPAGDITPGTVVAEAFARSLKLGGPFDEVTAVSSEPVGEARRNLDAIVRVSVPTWGLLTVRDGDAPLATSFVDVRAQLVARESGVVLWQHEEDVTHPERISAAALKQDRALSRENLTEVLERAGRRLASELLYARGRAQ
jgi:hypothetical protein